MAALNYLSGGESANVAVMNGLFGTLAEKMKSMLGGRSFLLAQTSQVPHYLMGKCFFFTSGTSNYASRAPDYLDSANYWDYTHVNPATGLNGVFVSGTPTTARAYTDSQFTSAVAALTSPGSYTWDETNKIVTVPQISSSAYSGLPYWFGGSGSNSVGLFEWSLAANYLMHQGSNDSAPVKYYIRDGATSQPERRYKYALAELIIEGPTSVTFSAAWDKYSCFRIHNMNLVGATVYFADGGYTVTLGPLQCLTVRRDWNGTGYQNYRLGGSYFLPFAGGDPRFYWFTPIQTPIRAYMHAGNGMQANNLTNPAIAYDWVDFLRRAPDASSTFCGWNDDANVQCDIHPLLSSVYGDPSNPATILGDLIHHKGAIKIKRTATSGGAITWDSVTFNGYATIVSDFAAKLLTVTTNGSGDLQIANGDSTHSVILYPVSTNLLKTGEVCPASVSLSSPFTIENAVFELEPDQSSIDSGGLTSGRPTLRNYGPQKISYPATNKYGNGKSWRDPYGSGTISPAAWSGGTAYAASATVTYGSYIYFSLQPNTGVTPGTNGEIWSTLCLVSAPSAAYGYAVGDTCDTDTWAMSRSSYPVFHGIHSKTVADITGMSWWADPALSSGTDVVISGAALTLAPNGLVLKFDEQDKGFSFKVARQFRFRGHGFGFSGGAGFVGGAYYSGYPPSTKAGYFSPLYARQIAVGPASDGGHYAYSGEVAGFSGADFDLSGWTFSDSGVKIVVRPEPNTTPSAGRFFKIAGDTLSGGNVLAMPLCAEMYNGLARAVLSTTIAVPLQYQCLFWVVNGHRVPLVNNYMTGAYSNTNSGHVDATTLSSLSYTDWTNYTGPRPMEQFAAFNEGSLFEALLNQLGITVQTTFPGGIDENGNSASFSYLQSKYTLPAVMYDRLDVTTSGASTSWNAGTSTLNCSATLTTQITSELLSLEKTLAGQATGARCIGTYNRATQLPTVGPPPFNSPVPAANPIDWNGVTAGSYYVADDGSGYVFMGGQPAQWVRTIKTAEDGSSYYYWDYASSGNTSGSEYYLFDVFPSPLAAGTDAVSTVFHHEGEWLSMQGIANIQGNEIYRGGPVNGGMYGGVNLYALTHYRWVKISDIQQYITVTLGFPFNWSEASVPLKLVYTLDPFTGLIKNQITGSESVSAAIVSPASVDHLSNADGGKYWRGYSEHHQWPDPNPALAAWGYHFGSDISENYDPINQQITRSNTTYDTYGTTGTSSSSYAAPFTREDYINAQKWSRVSLNNGGSSIFASQLRFVVTSDAAEALWKTGAPTMSNSLPAGAASLFGIQQPSWTEVYNITNNQTESPLTHYLDMSTASLAIAFSQPTFTVAFPDGTIAASVRPSSTTHACLLTEYVTNDLRDVVGSQNGAWSVVPMTANQLFTPGNAVWDQRQFIAFQIPDSSLFSEFIAMKGQGFWSRSPDWLASSLDNARAGAPACPWIYTAASPDWQTAVIGGLSIVSILPKFRYRVYLPTLQYDMQTLPTYSSPTPFGLTNYTTNATGSTGASTAATGASSGAGISGI